jgi:hypothetical protein
MHTESAKSRTHIETWRLALCRFSESLSCLIHGKYLADASAFMRTKKHRPAKVDAFSFQSGCISLSLPLGCALVYCFLYSAYESLSDHQLQYLDQTCETP